MKKLLSLSVAGVVLFGSFMFNQSLAMSKDQEDDCAIWLCLPAGFPQGCGGALSKFKDRIKHFRSPAPNFASCVIMPSNDIGIDFSSPQPPYEIKVHNVIYTNDGTNVKVSESRFNNMSKCPYNGEIITKKNYVSGSRYISETWLSAICTRTVEYGTTFNDYRFIYSEVGKPISVTKGNSFKPRMLSRSSSSNR